MIDGHIHYADSLEAERLRYIIEAYGLSGVALQCIPKGGKIPVEEDAFSFKRQSSVPVYIFGGWTEGYSPCPLAGWRKHFPAKSTV